MKKFLTAFTVVATTFANNAIASSRDLGNQNTAQDKKNTIVESDVGKAPKLSIVDSKGDEQLFILKRNSETDTLMAYHESHRSHSSHSSHRSHYSSR